MLLSPSAAIYFRGSPSRGKQRHARQSVSPTLRYPSSSCQRKLAGRGAQALERIIRARLHSRTRDSDDKPNVHKHLPTTPGKILFSLSAAQTALIFPPSRQSSNSKRGWRTGFEKDTRAESTKVMFLTPQPYTKTLFKKFQRIQSYMLTISTRAT